MALSERIELETIQGHRVRVRARRVVRRHRYGVPRQREHDVTYGVHSCTRLRRADDMDTGRRVGVGVGGVAIGVAIRIARLGGGTGARLDTTHRSARLGLRRIARSGLPVRWLRISVGSLGWR